jgi:hypothetical protein
VFSIGEVYKWRIARTYLLGEYSNNFVFVWLLGNKIFWTESMAQRVVKPGSRTPQFHLYLLTRFISEPTSNLIRRQPMVEPGVKFWLKFSKRYSRQSSQSAGSWLCREWYRRTETTNLFRKTSPQKAVHCESKALFQFRKWPSMVFTPNTASNRRCSGTRD